MKTSELKILEELIIKYKTETDIKRKHVIYLGLVDESLKLVKKIVAGVYPIPSSISRDDLIQVGAVGALKAIEMYETEDRGSFKTYAGKYIKGKVLQYIRDKGNIVKLPRDINIDDLNSKNIVSLDQNVFTIDGQETLLDRIQSENYEKTYENKKIIEYALNKLASIEKSVIYKYYIEGATKKEIAKEINVSATQVARIIKKSLNKMYNIIENDSKEE